MRHLYLGQSLTTDVGDSGSRALGDVHNDVRLDRLQSVADYVDQIINDQLICSIVELNYGSLEEMPTAKTTISRPKDEKGMVERDRALFLEMKVPVAEDYIYERYNIPKPKDGETLLAVGQQEQPEEEVLPDGGQGELATGQVLPNETKASMIIKANQRQAREQVDILVDNTLKDLTGVAAEWLKPVVPVFSRLAALAQAEAVTDEDFIAALETAQNEMPELFDRLDSKALEKALGDAIGASMLAGVENKLEEVQNS